MSFVPSVSTLLVPTLIRGLTFFLDSLWSSIIKDMNKSYLPHPDGILQVVVWTAFLTMCIVLFEKWITGSYVPQTGQSEDHRDPKDAENIY
jgi:hypothetical protein